MDQKVQQLTDSDMLKLGMYLGISKRMGVILGRLFNSSILTYEGIETDGLSRSHRHAISRLRARLDREGVEIQTHHGTGYWMGITSRENMLRLLRLAESEVGPNATRRTKS